MSIVSIVYRLLAFNAYQKSIKLIFGQILLAQAQYRQKEN